MFGFADRHREAACAANLISDVPARSRRKTPRFALSGWHLLALGSTVRKTTDMGLSASGFNVATPSENGQSRAQACANGPDLQKPLHVTHDG